MFKVLTPSLHTRYLILDTRYLIRYTLYFLFISNLSKAQTFTFTPSCQPTRDSLVENAFVNNCITNWRTNAGTPAVSSKGNVILNGYDAIETTKTFDKCKIHYINGKVFLKSGSEGILWITFESSNGQYFSRHFSLTTSASLGWTSFFMHVVQLPFEADKLIVKFSGSNMLLLDELSLATECAFPANFNYPLIGEIHASEEINLRNLEIKPGDTTTITSDQSIVIKDEVTWKEGAEVVVSIAPCPTIVGDCLPKPPPPPKEFLIYNFLTPNGDGQNDVFYIESIETYPESHLVIVNRAGKTVFETKNYNNTWNGGDEPNGNYHYQLRLQKGQKPITGELLLTR